MEPHSCIDLLELWRFLFSFCVVFGGSLILLLYLFLLTLIYYNVVSHQYIYMEDIIGTFALSRSVQYLYGE